MQWRGISDIDTYLATNLAQEAGLAVASMLDGAIQKKVVTNTELGCFPLYGATVDEAVR